MRGMFNPPDEAVFQGSNNDNVELLKAWGGTTLAYAIMQTGASSLLRPEFFIILVISGVVCGLGIVLHELAHRIVARNYGAEAHFVANNGFLVISIVIAFLGLFIAAPGAVWHRGYLTKQQSGLIAVAGPATNLVFALLFLVAWPLLVFAQVDAARLTLLGFSLADLLFFLCVTGFKLNAFIGLFNMIPAGPFDGAKVLDWSPLYFGITLAIAVLLTFGLEPVAVWRWLGV